MLCTSELDMAESVKASDIDVFLSDATWAICTTYHTVLKASPGAAIFGRDMLFDILFIADWQKIGEHRQQLTDLSNVHETEGRIDYGYKVGQEKLLPFSATMSLGGIRNLGSLQQSIRTEQSRFSMETN